jgi:hypothetical protein
MNGSVWPPEIGQWYSRTDKGEMFQVVGRDEAARTVEIQTFDGDLDEIDDEAWRTLGLERVAAPEDWTGPLDDVEPDDLGCSDTEMRPADWNAPLQPISSEREGWTDTQTEDERDPLGEGAPEEPFIADLPEADARAH